jgi:predicted secreted acid phosphatase
MRPTNIQSAKNEVIAYNDKETGKLYKDYYLQMNLAMGVIVPYFGKSQYCNVLDMDETIVDKSCFGKSEDFGYTPDVLVEGWTRTDIPAFEEMIKFMKLSMDNELGIYIITARNEFYRDTTVKQLVSNGIIEGKHYARLIMKPDNSQESTIVFKSRIRKELEDQGLIILVNAGDHDDDLSNPDGTFSGIYPVLLPNYMY